MIDPVIVQLGPLQLRWYGVMVALGVLAAYGLMLARGKRYGVAPDTLGNIMLLAVVPGLIGARLFYVIRFWSEEFAGRPLANIFALWNGGLVFQGGFILAAIAIAAYAWRIRLPIGAVGDLAAAALPLGHALGRIGCLLNGCCYGFTPYEGVFAVHYNGALTAGAFPVQAVESIGNLLLCVGVLLLERRRLARGKLFLLYLLGYTLLRCCIEPLRGDYPMAQRWYGMTPGQYNALWQVPVILGVYALVWHIQRRRTAKSTDENPSAS